MKQRALVVTHDIDWPFNGPRREHVLQRQDRFSPEILAKVKNEGFNPYFGISKIMEIEKTFGLHSTFFFRPCYDDGSTVGNYRQTIRELLSGGWEVGLHCNSTSTAQDVMSEKSAVEEACGHSIQGSRVHYLRIGEKTFENLSRAGIKYDSSLSYNKEQIDIRNTGFLRKDGLVIFPVTFMDAYLFSYMNQTEETVVRFVLKSIEGLFSGGVSLVTLLWHDNSIFMKGGRAYEELIKQLARLRNITFLKGIEAYELNKNHWGP